MSSGNKRVKFNTRERIISNDANLVQTFSAAERNHLFKRLVNRPSAQFRPMSNPGVYPEVKELPAAGSYGTVHDVYSGLMVRPDLQNELHVDSGVAGFVIPDFSDSEDDSDYILVRSPGVQASGAGLDFVANVAAGPRIDIVECRPVEVVVSQQSRDIHNPLTDDFNAQVVDKVLEARLEFRIRQGTVDQGFPDLDQEWLPLAFVVVTNGAAGFNECDVYDIRPLVSERSNDNYTAMVQLGDTNVLPNARILFRSIRPEGATPNRANGWVVGEFAGYRIGGVIRRNTPSASLPDVNGDDSFFDAAVSSNRTIGSYAPSTTDNSFSVLALAFPKGLGRCVRYSQGSAVPPMASQGQVQVTGRLPQGTNGIALLVGGPALSFTSGSTASILESALPSVFGSSIANVRMPIVVVGWYRRSGSNWVALMSNGKRHFVGRLAAGQTPYTITADGGSFPDNAADISLDLIPSNTMWDWSTDVGKRRFPTNAARVLLESQIVAVFDPGTEGVFSVSNSRVHITDSAGHEVWAGGYIGNVWAGGTGQHRFIDEIEAVALYEPWQTGNSTAHLRRRLTRGAGANFEGTFNVNYAQILGWEDI